MRTIGHCVFATILASGASLPAADQVIRFDLANHTADRIIEVYVTPAKAPKWGENLLKQDGLQGGRTTTVSFAGPCGLYAVRLVAPGGTEYLDDEVSFCTEHDVLTVDKGEITKARRSEQK